MSRLSVIADQQYHLEPSEAARARPGAKKRRTGQDARGDRDLRLVVAGGSATIRQYRRLSHQRRRTQDDHLESATARPPHLRRRILNAGRRWHSLVVCESGRFPAAPVCLMCAATATGQVIVNLR